MEFLYDELHKYSEGFTHEIGSGGFGDVFLGSLTEIKGELEAGTQVAIKASHGFLQGETAQIDLQLQWDAEKRYLLSLDHPNIIKLYGFAQRNKVHYLVYEYMPHGPVGQRLEDLNWAQTKKIAQGSVAAMRHLHEKNPALIMRDFKAGNILLDEKYNPKLSDFGLVREGGVEYRNGTPGSTDPRSIKWGTGSKETDMYSVGILLLQLITKRYLYERQIHIATNVQNDLEAGNDITHALLSNTGCPDEEANLVIQMALQCIDNLNPRPTITDVDELLQNLN